MMKELNIFKDEYVDLFMPNDGVEFLHNIIYSLGFDNDEVSSKKAKSFAMGAIKELLKLDLIEVFHWGAKHEEMKDKTYSNEEILEYIDASWHNGAGIPDFYNMIMFKHKDWYTKRLKELGMHDTVDWSSFVREKIINIKSIIES